MASISTVPLQMIQFEVYYSDSTKRLLGTATIDLPDLNYATVDVKGAGILGRPRFTGLELD